MRYNTISRWSLLLILSATSSAWADLDSDILQLQRRWAEVNYHLQGDTQLTAFETLIQDAEKVTAQYPEAADAWIWDGIIQSTYAGAKGGLSALKFAKVAKADLDKAIKIDPDAMQGSAYASLGTLYFSVPGWPLGFGDDDKANELLLKALELNPDGIDSNFFYADFLRGEKRHEEARSYLLKAQAATPRPDRPLADAGRQKEITHALLEVNKELDR